MSRHGVNVESVPYDGHLVRAVQRLRIHRRIAEQVAELAREENVPLPIATATLAGDPQRLRGLPAIGRNVSGAMRGTQPDLELLRHHGEEGPALYALAVLATGVDGTSPAPTRRPKRCACSRRPRRAAPPYT
jgi:hypothetical protein